MSIKKQNGGTRNLSAGFILSVLAMGGCHSAARSLDDPANKTLFSANAAHRTMNKMIVIEQGMVGTVGKFSVGVKNIAAADGDKTATVDLSVWSDALPKEKRNDYNVKFTAGTGTVVPVGNRLYRIGRISGRNGARAGSVEIESEAVGGLKLDDTALAVPVGGNLELHGTVVEIISVAAENGKTSASVETYSNDYPKEELAKKDAVTKIKRAAGDEITIGDRKHKIVGVHAAKDGVPGIVEISIAPVD